MSQQPNSAAKELGTLLLEVSVYLPSSEACCSRISVTMRRLVIRSDTTTLISIVPQTGSLTLDDDEDNALFNGMLTILAPGDWYIVSMYGCLLW